MSRWLRVSSSQTERIGPFLDATDGVTEETGLTLPPTEISKDGAAFGTGPTGVHDAEGWYSVALTSTHTNTLGSFVIKSHDNTTHLPVWHEFMVLPADVYDSLVVGTDELPVNVIQWFGSTVSPPATAGVPAVDVITWRGAIVATPTVAGVPEVDITHTDGVSGAGNAIANALLDLANAIETGLTLRQAQRLIAAATAGKLSGAATTTILIRDAVVDSKDRITATVDSDGNRSAITYDVS